MVLDMRVIHTSDFIRLTPRGETDLARSRRALSKLAAECVARGVRCALLDAREAPGSLSIADLYDLATSFHDMGFRSEHRLAVLHKKGEGERARFFAECSANRGWNVREFDSFESAFAWFSTAEEVGERGGEGGGVAGADRGGGGEGV